MSHPPPSMEASVAQIAEALTTLAREVHLIRRALDARHPLGPPPPSRPLRGRRPA